MLSYRTRRTSTVIVVLALLLFAGPFAAGAFAATGVTAADVPAAPATDALPATVSADALPTVQIDGVVWKQAIVGQHGLRRR